jgi:heat shock protein HslJ
MSISKAIVSKLLAGLCIVFLFMLPGCKSSDTTTNSTPVSGDILDGTQWKLISLNGSPPVNGSYISLYFNNGGMWGSAGINIYGVQYSIQSPDVIILGMGSITEMGGPEYLVQQEELYAQSIFKASHFSIDNPYLNIFDADRVKTLVFERLTEYPVNPADLIGTKWWLVNINKEPVIEGLSITLNFGSDEGTGQSGCFVYSLYYDAGLFYHPGDNIRWGNSSKRTGELPEDQEDQASSYLGKIAVAAYFNLIDDKLEIFTARGDTLVFKPVNEADTTATGIPHVFTKIEAPLTLDGTELN